MPGHVSLSLLAIKFRLYCFCRKRASTEINCTIPSVNSTSTEGQVVVRIDGEVIRNGAVVFTYRGNPMFISVQPQFTIVR